MGSVANGRYGTYYYVYSNSEMLNTSERLHNCYYIYHSINSLSFEVDLLSVCAILGNMMQESGINPNQIQLNRNLYASDTGYGLSQWTPASKIAEYVKYLRPAFPQFTHYTIEGHSDIDMDAELEVLKHELLQDTPNLNQWTNVQSRYDTYELSGIQFLRNDRGYTIDVLTEIYLHHYERGPSSSGLANRISYAKAIYLYLTGEEPPTEPTEPKYDDATDDPENIEPSPAERDVRKSINVFAYNDGIIIA